MTASEFKSFASRCKRFCFRVQKVGVLNRSWFATNTAFYPLDINVEKLAILNITIYLC